MNESTRYANTSHFGSDIVVGARPDLDNALRLTGSDDHPGIAAVGDDSNVSVLLTSKGTGVIVPTVGTVMKFVTVTTLATAGAATYTAAQLLGGIILRDPAGADRSDVTPTAALLIAAIPGAVVGTAFEFTIRNTADAAETITVTAGTGVTLSGTMTIVQNNTKRFLAVVTSASAVTIYSLGTIVH